MALYEPVHSIVVLSSCRREALEVLGYNAELKAGILPPLDAVKARAVQVLYCRYVRGWTNEAIVGYGEPERERKGCNGLAASTA